MSAKSYPLKLPESVKEAAKELAKADGVSLNQFIISAVAEKIGALRAIDALLKDKTSNARPIDMQRFLDNAPDVKPDEDDVIDSSN